MENFTTITRLQGKNKAKFFIENEHLMMEIQAPEVIAIKCNLVNSS